MQHHQHSSLRNFLLNPPAQQFVTRFAPSPTGYLHLGHVASLIYVMGMAQILRARVILRMEDHDQTRVRKHFTDAIMADLEWLGLDLGMVEHSTQSQHWQRYDDVLQAWIRSGDVYACACSRQTIKRFAHAEHDDPHVADELFYPAICRDKNLEVVTRREPSPTSIRWRTPTDDVIFDDLFVGPQIQMPSRQCGDLLLKDRDGCYTYQFAVGVDDVSEHVNLIVRGQDLLASTGRQILLHRKLSPHGASVPMFFLHHPLVLADDGTRKLSKREKDTAIKTRREAGESPATVLASAARSAGLHPHGERLFLADAGQIILDGLST